jgi:hypothetical protein
MAGGGIVAFADGGTPEDMIRANREANAALAGMGRDDGLTLPGGFRFREYNMPAPTDIKSEMALQREAEREAGVDTDLYKRMREEEAGRRDELKARREEAKGEALLMAGLGLMGARKGQEFQALSDVGRQAVQQYSGALREIRDTEKDIKKTERELMFAEDRAKRDTSGKVLGRVQAKRDKLEDLQIRQTDQYNKAVEERAKLNMEQYKVDSQTAREMALAQFRADKELERTKLDIASRERIAYAPSDTERMLAKVQALQKAGKKEEADNLLNTHAQIKFGSQRTGEITRTTAFKEYNDLVEKDLAGKFQKQYPTFEDYWRAMQNQAGSKPPTTFSLSPEAQKALQQYGGR